MRRWSVVGAVWQRFWVSGLLLVSAGVLPGCSFLFVTPPPAKDPTELVTFEQHRCTTSLAAPIADTLIAGLEAARTAIALGSSDSKYQGYPISRGADIGLGVGLLALFAASSVYGYVYTGECKEMHGKSGPVIPARRDSWRAPDSDDPPPPPPGPAPRH